MGFEFYEERDFKDTELGPLPVDWKVVRLGEVAEIIMGQSPPGETYNSNGKGVPFLQGKAEFGNIYPNATKYTTHPIKTSRIGSILFSVRAPVGDVNIADREYCIGRGLACIELREDENEFLFYYFNFAKEKIEKLGTGSTFKAISKSELQTLSIPLPPLEEQKAIAEVLRSVQLAIEKTEEVIRATKELKKSMMKHLFTYGYVPVDEIDKVRLKETEIGLIPEHWNVVRLGDVAEIKYGKAKPKDNGTIPVIGSGGIYDWTNSALVNFPTVVVGRKGTAGQVWLIEQPCWPSDTTYYLVWKHVVDIRFVFEFLNLNPLSGKHAKTTLPSLQRPDLENYLIPLPPLEEQKAIAEVLRAIDEKLQKEEEYKKALQNLFKSLLYHLMSGKIRVRRTTN